MLNLSTTARFFALSLTVGSLSALAAPFDPSQLPPASDRKDLSFEKDIKPMFETSCTRCHGPEKPKAGLRLDLLEGVLKGSKEGKVLTPGDGTKSLIIKAVSQLDPESAMPPKPKPGKRGPSGGGQAPGQGGGTQGRPPGPPPKPLTAEQVGILRAWVDQGAK
jgi:hypothetical protein